MRAIHPKLVTDEQMHPVAVQIDYEDWVKIQEILQNTKVVKEKSLEKYAGSLQLDEDPLKYQKKIRSEWR